MTTKNLLFSPNEVNIIVRYCAEEVRRQYNGAAPPARVAGMVTAWIDAIERRFRGESVTPEAIEWWGAAIEPQNAAGFRSVPVFVGWEEKADWRLVPRMIEGLCENIENLSALDAYREFENIHPFTDGNGRTGKIILNWMNGTLLDPIFPPEDFWGPRIDNP